MNREWRDLAACAGRAPEFDATVEGETDQQRIDRHGVAKYVCNNECPVKAQCRADFVKHVDSGVRFGEVHGLPRNGVLGGGNGKVGKQDVIKHGREYGAQQHRKRGEKVCSACHAAELRARVDRDRKRASA